MSDINKTVHRQFLNWLACVLIGGVLAVLAFVIVIDPYNLYGLFVIKGINTVKPQVSRHIEEVKLTQALKLKPDTLIFGNSRADIGFDPESPVLLTRNFSAYNLAIPGTAISTAILELEYLLKKSVKPKRIIIGLDFVDFVQIARANSTSEESHGVEFREFPAERWFWRFDSLFSMASINDSVHTLLIQHSGNAGTMTIRGFNPLREYETLARNEGYYVLFRQRAEENAKVYLKKSAGSLDQSQFKLFRHMLESASNAGSEVIVVIYPYHAQILALFEQTGLFPKFVQWKHRLVTEVADLLQQRANASISVFDFSGFWSYQCQSIPAKGDIRSVSHWYWEAGHFKKALGDVLIGRLFSDTVGGDDSNVFGVKLNLANFHSNLERIDREKEQCMKANPQLFEEVSALVHELTRK